MKQYASARAGKRSSSHTSKVRAKVDRAFDRTTITTLRGRGYRLETSP
ncbi:helix-turn-helix domain-containing protein [Streptomyces sp. RLB3-17]|nr:helix-turn-helix domain-containing protein [Streptomyces sp. RLB3-17]